MDGLETIRRRNHRAAGNQGLWCKVADMDGGRWFAGDVIDVRDDPAGNVTVRLRPACLAHKGQLPQYQQDSSLSWGFLLTLWLGAQGLLWLLNALLG